ncbi:hypothetical protein D927_02728 [Enterococcus faecalis 02-MB-BW-10]|nr:predicted protein [Enterococcus faecalis ARO1/DG]EPH76439.1 hypothetical protein D927_02728 [Enterococcus faecalis 02-MB-BW-10]
MNCLFYFPEVPLLLLVFLMCFAFLFLLVTIHHFRSKEFFMVDQTSTPFVYFFFISANFFATPCPLLLHNGQGIAFA